MRVATVTVFPRSRLFVAAGIVMFLLGLCGCSEESGTAQMKQPVVTSISRTEVSMGDTVVISGHDFNPQLASNRIVTSSCGFSGSCSRYSIPVAGSDTHLVGRVPDGAMTGGIRIEDIDPLAGTPFFRVKIAPLASNALNFRSLFKGGDVGKVFFSGTEFEFEVDASSGDEEYVLIVFNNTTPPSDSWNYWYTVSLNYTFPMTASGIGSLARSGSVQTANNDGGIGRPEEGDQQHIVYGTAARNFKRRLRDEVIELLELANAGMKPFHPSLSGADSEQPGQSVYKTPAQTRQFKVLEDPTLSIMNPDNFVIITANLKYEGDHTLLYVDQNTPTSNLSDTEARDLGITFDEQIYQRNHTYFGVESDINEDGKVAILLTPRVNMLSLYTSGDGIIVGYFMPTDLLPRYVHPDATNAMEVFYSIVPDPGGDFGPNISKERALDVIREVLAHEFQHMIMFNYRVLIYGDGSAATYVEELWMDEGLSHIAEDLNGYERSNIERANLFLIDPGSANLIFKDEDDLDKRGAVFLFLRHLGDRFGDGIYAKLVQSKSSGVENVENATDENFLELFADWIAACYLSGTGITEDERFNYTSLDLKADFQPLNVIDIPGWNEFTRFIETMSPEYIAFRVSEGNAAVLSIECGASGRMNAIVVRID